MTRPPPRDPTGLHSRFDSRAAMSAASDLPDMPTSDDDVGGEDRYARIAEIGSGGMARVFLARDRRLGRDVALKVSTAPAHDALFAREAALTASLEHPGILPVHDRGIDADGRPFFATPFVPGQTLQRWLADDRDSDERHALLRTLLLVVETVAFAHARSIVHRDLKPSNIILGHHGRPVVIDWAFGADLAGTMAVGAAPKGGTPRYMSPEQAEGQAPSPGDDVHALGSLLFETIAGVPPMATHATGDHLTTSHEPPRPPTGTPRALAAIIARALAPDPARRYPDAAPLARDLRNYLERRPVDAYRYAVWERLSLWLRRWRVPATVGAVALLLLFIVGAVALVNVSAERAHVEALLGETLAASAWRALDDERRDMAVDEARRALAYRPTAEGRAVLASVPAGVVTTRKIGTLPCRVTDLAPDQGRALCAPMHDEQAAILLAGTRPMARIAWPLLRDVFFMGGGERVVALHEGRYAFHDARTGDPVMVMAGGCMGRLRDATGGDATIDLSPWCAALISDDSVSTHDTLGCRMGGLLAANIDSAGRRLISACDDGHVWVHDIAGEREPKRVDLGLKPPWFGITAVAFVDTSNRVILGTQHGWLARIDLDEPERRVMLRAHGLIQHIELDPNRSRAVFQRLDGGPVVVDIEAWSPLTRLGDDVTAVAFDRDGKLWTAGATLSVHDLDALLPRSTTVLAGATAMAVSPDGRTVAVGQDAWVSTIDARTRLPLGHTRWQEGVIKSITYDANGTLHAHGVGSPDLVSISDDLLQHIASVQAIDYSLRAIPLSNGGVLSAHWNRPLVMWRDGKVVRDMGVGRIRDMRVATNGRDVAALDADGRSWTGMFVTGEEGLVACEHVPGATAIAMSDDSAGPMVAVLTETQVIGVCGDISVHSTSGPKLASFSVGRQWIVAGAREGTVMAWRRGDAAPRMIARAHDERVSAVVLAPDETWFATAGWDGRVMFWQLPGNDHPDAAVP